MADEQGPPREDSDGGSDKMADELRKALREEIVPLKDSVTELRAVTAEIVPLKDSITELRDSVTELRAVTAEIVPLKDSITELRDSVAELRAMTAEIVPLKDSIAANTAAINTLNTNVTAQTTMLREHDTRIADIENVLSGLTSLPETIEKLNTNLAAHTRIADKVLTEHSERIASTENRLSGLTWTRWAYPAAIVALVLVAVFGSFRLGSVENQVKQLATKTGNPAPAPKQEEKTLPIPPESPAAKQQPSPVKSGASANFEAVVLVTNPVKRTSGGLACVVAEVSSNSRSLITHEIVFGDSAIGVVANIVKESAKADPNAETLLQGKLWIEGFRVHVPADINQDASYLLRSWPPTASAKLMEKLKVTPGLSVSPRSESLPAAFRDLGDLPRVFAVLKQKTDSLQLQ
jgi:predicted  nucleic acid-binding Zn-ribbon protein